jgi:hypothetical protein
MGTRGVWGDDFMGKVSVLVLAGCLLASGCGGGAADAPTLAPADGTVTYKGSAVADASVTFQPEKGPIATGTTDAEGKFTLFTGSEPGATVGNGVFLVRVVDASNAPMVQTSGGASGGPPNVTEMMMQAQQKQRESKKRPTAAKLTLPAKYADPRTSDLQKSINADGEQNHFELSLND